MIQTFRVSLIGAGQTFGEEDVMAQRDYSCSVRCISKVAEVFCMKHDEFLRKFKGNKDSW
jgi:CRP-like cAMP-binding protein